MGEGDRWRKAAGEASDEPVVGIGKDVAECVELEPFERSARHLMAAQVVFPAGILVGLRRTIEAGQRTLVGLNAAQLAVLALLLWRLW